MQRSGKVGTSLLAVNCLPSISFQAFPSLLVSVQKVMVELHSSDGPQNASNSVRTPAQKWSGNKIREPGTPKHTTPEAMTPRRTVLSVRNSMSTPLGGRISGDLTPSTPKLEGVYKYGQGAPSFRGGQCLRHFYPLEAKGGRSGRERGWSTVRFGCEWEGGRQRRCAHLTSALCARVRGCD